MRVEESCVIILAGTIGAGKSSLTSLLADHLNSQAFYEEVDNNEVLPLFYDDPNQYAFLLQIYFLNKRFASLKKAGQQANNVLDRSIYEDSLLFHLNADLGRANETEVKVYDELLQNMMEELPFAIQPKHPDLLIHVKVSFETMLARIEKRGRPYEQISKHPELLSYYQELNQRYQAWYDDYDASAKIEIDGDVLNFVESKAAQQTVLQLIDKKLLEIRR